MLKIARTPKTLRQSHHQIIKVLIVTGGYYDYKGEASTELFDFPTGTILHFTPTWIHWGQTVEKLLRNKYSKSDYEMKVWVFKQVTFGARLAVFHPPCMGWEAQVLPIFSTSFVLIPLLQHIFSTGQLGKITAFSGFSWKKVPYQNLFFKREGIVQFFILP